MRGDAVVMRWAMDDGRDGTTTPGRNGCLRVDEKCSGADERCCLLEQPGPPGTCGAPQAGAAPHSSIQLVGSESFPTRLADSLHSTNATPIFA